VEVQVTSRLVDDVAVLEVVGELDLYTSPKLKAALDAALGQGQPRLVVNLLQTTYLDSTALGMLNAALHDAKKSGGTLALVFAQPQMSRLFAMTGLASVFPIFSAESEAIATVRGWRAGHPAS
jgi:anti-sigma B factor antagonist